MRLVIKLEGVVGVGEFLLGLLLHFFVCGNPVKKFGAVAHVFGVSRLVCLERAVMPLPFSFWDYFLVLEVLSQSNAASHNDNELHVVHCTAAGIRGKVFFHNLFCGPADASRKSCESCRFNDSLNKLVVGHSCV